MSPGDHSPVDGAEEQNNPTTGNSTSEAAAQDIPSAHGPVGGGNAVLADLISVQPAAAAAAEASSQRDPQKMPSCPRRGLAVPEQRLRPLSPGVSPQRGSGSGRRSQKRTTTMTTRRRSRSSEAGSPQATTSPADCCPPLLLACLSCRVAALLLGLLEACASCLHALCAPCCRCCGRACARCCSAVREAPVEELHCHAHCHAVLFESCCEPTECLEFCLECCDICHRS